MFPPMGFAEQNLIRVLKTIIFVSPGSVELVQVASNTSVLLIASDSVIR